MSPSAPSLSVRLYGTEEAVTPPRILRAGDLTAELDAGNLRHIRYGGIEVIRAVSYIVRDRNWGTYNPAIRDLKVEEGQGGFTVTYQALAGDDKQSFRYDARIEGRADGSLTFHCTGEAVSDFLTNRTGFVVLHPIQGVSGEPVEIEHVDGRVVRSAFPALIDPVQPMMELRALTHEAAPGLTVTCRMEGDTFEMEDQRNWSDASYKTYVRPLALPWPYTLAAGTTLDQTVTVSVTGRAPAATAAGGTVTVKLGEQAGTAPKIGLGYDPADATATRSAEASLARLHPQHLIIHHDRRQGHDAGTLREGVAIAGALGAEPWLEAVVTEVEDFEKEVRALGKDVATLGSPFPVVLLSPASDMKSTLPGSVWPPAPDAAALFSLAREVFPDARLGGGMFSYFTELNRKRPPLDKLDFVSFSTSAMVHAGDDHSVMEGLESLPAIAGSARAIAGDLPLAVGPSAIGMRMNPYGAAPMENPGNIRQAMNRNDPRQRGLLGAAWTLGYLAHFARAGFSAIAFGDTTGRGGVVAGGGDWPQPWYDQAGGLFPVYHVLRGLARLAGQPLVAVDIDAPSTVQGIAARTEAGTELWLANLTPQSVTVTLPAAAGAVAVLDADAFAEASATPDLLDHTTPAADTRTLDLGPYAVARILFN